MHRLALVVLAGLAAAILAISLASTGGAQTTATTAARTIRFTESAHGSFHLVDNAPKSRRGGQHFTFSPGDSFVSSTPLLGHRGRLRVTCTAINGGGFSRAIISCQGSFTLRGGELVGTGVIGTHATTFRVPITGGTGAYAGARGTLTSVNQRNGQTKDTIRLVS